MKKTIIAACMALALAGTAAAQGDKAYTIEGVHNYGGDESTGIRLGISTFKQAAGQTFTHEYGASLGYMTDDSRAKDGRELTMIPLTLHYYANTEVADKVTVFAGVRAGIVKMDESVNNNDEDTTAPIIMIGAGLKFKLTERTDLRFSYEVGRSYPSDDEAWGERRGLRTLSLGVNVAF